MFRKPIPAFSLGIVLTLAVLGMTHPGTKAALAKLQAFFKIGEHTYINEIPALSTAAWDSILTYSDESQERGETYFLYSVYGGMGGAVPPGEDPFVKQVTSLTLAAGLVDYRLPVPTYFDKRIPPRLRFQKAQIMPGGGSMLYFGIGPLETVITCMPVGPERTVGYSESVSTVDKDGVRTMTNVPPDLEELEIDGKQVFFQVHSEGVRRNLGGWSVKFPEKVIGKFLWEDGGLSLTLDGKFLTKEEGIKIIESLEMTGPSD